jgi:hypothetical protein
MYIYNVTVNIDDSAHKDWVNWMRETHIPDVLNTGLFASCRFCKVMVDEESGTTYSIQYLVKDLETLQLYQQLYAPALQKEHTERYKGKFVAFRTILELKDEIKPGK